MAGQAYISYSVWQLLPDFLWLKLAVILFMNVAFLLFFLAMSGVLDRLSLGLATVIYNVGTSWLIIMFYMVMLFALLHLGRAVHLIPSHLLQHSWWGTGIVAVILVAIFGYARWHYEDKQRVELVLDGKGKVKSPKKLVLVSDLHLGYHNRRSDLRRWLEQLKAEQPDVILIAGDLIDRTIKPVNEEDAAEEFRKLGIPVYAIFGNHDYYTGTNADREFCRKAGIHLLQDEVAYWGDFAFVGRDDRTNLGRKSLATIMRDIDRTKYIIDLDHQPYHLEEAEKNGVDFEFAGHTHHGQVWPGNWVTDLMYENAFGKSQRGTTTYYVSSGLGIWGAKFRIGTQSEYVVATFK